LHKERRTKTRFIGAMIKNNSAQKDGSKSPVAKSHTPIILLTRKEVGKMLNVSLVTLDKWIAIGIIKAYRIGTNVRFKPSEIEDALTLIPSKKGGANG
jgi:excisionase family DNA binding protein